MDEVVEIDGRIACDKMWQDDEMFHPQIGKCKFLH